MEISFPLDDDGFLRRECPTCLREFKWSPGSTADKPEGVRDPDQYYCPYCGEAAYPDSWWTNDQLEYAKDAAAREADSVLRQELEGLQSSTKGSWVTIEVESATSPKPWELVEVKDMFAVASPCHPYEPIKIADDWAGPVCCLVCGSRFIVPEA